MRQRLQRRTEPILHLARAVGDTTNLSVLTAEERHNPVCLAQRIGFYDYRVAFQQRHRRLPELWKVTRNFGDRPQIRSRIWGLSPKLEWQLSDDCYPLSLCTCYDFKSYFIGPVDH